MQFLTDTKIPFLKYRRLLVWLSFVAMVLSLVAVFVHARHHLRHRLQGRHPAHRASMRDAVDANDLRNAVDGAGIREAQIQQYGPAEAHEFLIRVPLATEGRRQEEGRGQRRGDHQGARRRLQPRPYRARSTSTSAAAPPSKRSSSRPTRTTRRPTSTPPTPTTPSWADAIVAKRKEVKLFTSLGAGRPPAPACRRRRSACSSSRPRWAPSR